MRLHNKLVLSPQPLACKVSPVQAVHAEESFLTEAHRNFQALLGHDSMKSGGTQETKFPANRLTQHTRIYTNKLCLTWYLHIEGNKSNQIDDRHAPEEHAPWKDDFSHV